MQEQDITRKNLESYLKNNGVKARHICKMLRCDDSTISHFRRGRSLPNRLHINLIDYLDSKTV